MALKGGMPMAAMSARRMTRDGAKLLCAQEQRPARPGYTRRDIACTIGIVERLNITLDDERAEKLARLADRMHIQPGTIARSLLSSALDETDADATNVAALLDGIPGALTRAEVGREQAYAGKTISLDQL
jgi:hypothetical protein